MSRRMDHAKANLDTKVKKQNLEDIQELRTKGLPPPRAKAGAEAKSSKPAKKITQAERIEAIRRNYVQAVKRAISAGKTPPQPFKKLGKKLRKEIQQSDSIENWARSQPEYIENATTSTKTASTVATRSSEKWRRDLTKAISLLEDELARVEEKRKELKAEIKRKNNALGGLKGV